MKRFPEYKDSGIEWFGKIPAHWKVKRIKDIVKINSETLKEDTPYDYTFKYIDISNVSSDGVITPSEDMTFYESPSRARRIIHKGDVIVSTVRTYLKAIAPIDFDANNIIASTGFAVLTPFEIESSYLKYLILSSPVIDQFCSQSTGVSYPAISSGKISALSALVPSHDEQRAIADYLDKKCGEIDGQVALLEKKRDAYARLKISVINKAVTHGLNPDISMRPSGIDWIGDIPAHWERLRLKDVSYMYSGLTGKSGDDFRCDDDTKTKPFVPFTNVLNNTKIDFNQFNRVVMAEGEQQNRVLENDLIFLMSSEDYESIAKSAVVVGDPGEVYLNSFCRGLHFTSNDVYAPFVNYQLNSEKYHDALRFEARGFTRINIKVDRVFSQFITVPPLAEQREIADYLDKKCGEIDAVVENLDKQINAYKRLKKSLINEVVTGKRAV